MKAIRMMMFVAVATMLFAACGKDDPVEAKANTLVYNGTVYQMKSYYKYEQGGRVYIDAHAVETTGEGLPIFSIISDDPANGTYDLTAGTVFFGVSSNVDYIQSFYSESTYTGGTLTVEKDDSAFRLKMSGTLADGTTVSFHIYVPASEWEQLEW